MESTSSCLFERLMEGGVLLELEEEVGRRFRCNSGVSFMPKTMMARDAANGIASNLVEVLIVRPA